MRLYKVRDEFKGSVTISVKAFPLRPQEEPQRRPAPYIAQAMARAGAEGKKDGLILNPWPQDKFLPSSSMPGLAASKCAALQGEEAFAKYDLALFTAYFERTEDISQREVLVRLAGDAGLDVARFQRDLEDKAHHREVLQEYMECVQHFGPWATGVPLQTFNGGPPLVGCYPIEIYRATLLKHLNA